MQHRTKQMSCRFGRLSESNGSSSSFGRLETTCHRLKNFNVSEMVVYRTSLRGSKIDLETLFLDSKLIILRTSGEWEDFFFKTLPDCDPSNTWASRHNTNIVLVVALRKCFHIVLTEKNYPSGWLEYSA